MTGRNSTAADRRSIGTSASQHVCGPVYSGGFWTYWWKVPLTSDRSRPRRNFEPSEVYFDYHRRI